MPYLVQPAILATRRRRSRLPRQGSQPDHFEPGLTPPQNAGSRSCPMVLGMSLATFTLLHVLISLVGIVTGFVVLYGMLHADRLPTWTAIFLASTILTSITGFFFPFEHLLPSHIVGVISLV